MTLEVKEEKQKERDVRIEEASAISSLLKHSGYKILLKYYNIIKEDAHKDILDPRIRDDTLVFRRDIYNQIDRWLNIPVNIIKVGEQAILEKSHEDERPDTKVKDSDTPYVGRRY